MEQKKKTDLKKAVKIILIILAITAGILLIKYLAEENRKWKYVSTVMQQFIEKVEDLENLSDTSGYISSIEAKVERHIFGEDSIFWVDWVHIDVELTKLFRSLPEKERCTFIIKYEKDFDALIREIKRECGYDELEEGSEKLRYLGKEHNLSEYTIVNYRDNMFSYYIYGDEFKIGGKDHNYHIYETYNFKYKNGEVTEFEEEKFPSYYVPKSTTPSKKYSYSSGSNKSYSSPSGSSGRKLSDPYDADAYDDPDDFAADWEDEFDSYDDAYDYWEDAMN